VKRGVLILLTVLALMMSTFGASSQAAMENCDFSGPKDGDIDGGDLAQFIAHYSATDSAADVNGDAAVDSGDVAHFAGFYGASYSITARRPNILLIIGDDIGFDVTTDMYPGLIDDLLDKYGEDGLDFSADKLAKIDGTPASTPILDSLAQKGMRFSNAWAQPYCSPTRASIITGLFAAKNNVTTYTTYLSENHNTFVQKLRDEAGYSTAAFGKWHLAGFPVDPANGMMPKQAGFELYKGILGAAPSSYWATSYVMQNDTTGDEATVTVTVQPRTLDGIGPTIYLPVVKVTDTIDWINEKQTQNPDKPWFAYLAMNMSHATTGNPNMVVPDEDTLDAESHAEMMGCKDSGSFGSNNVGSCNGEQLMRAMTNSMDTVIGKLLEAVDSIPSDTYIIYIGDNGTPMYSFGNLGHQIGNMYITREGHGKGTAYESGARVAMTIKGPGIAAGSQSSEFVHAVDLFSTILDLAGLTPPVNVPDYLGDSTLLDSVSLAPILYDSVSNVRDPNTGYILTECIDLLGGSAVRMGARNAEYKVVCVDGSGTNNCEFFDLETDPLEEIPLDAYETTNCEGWDTGDPQWHYCHLIGVINDHSLLSQ